MPKITTVGRSDNNEYIHLSAHRETHLRELEAHTGDMYEICPEPCTCIPDADNKANLIWTLRKRP